MANFFWFISGEKSTAKFVNGDSTLFIILLFRSILRANQPYQSSEMNPGLLPHSYIKDSIEMKPGLLPHMIDMFSDNDQQKSF